MKYVEITICLTGMALLANWLLKTSLGRTALVGSKPRRNDMPIYVPFIPFFMWFGVVSLMAVVAKELAKDLPTWKSAIVDNVVFCAGATLTTILIVILAWVHFARRLKGFGLNIKTCGKDLWAGSLNLFAVWPLIWVAIKVTVFVAGLFSDQEYQMQQHKQLEVVAEHPQMMLRILIVVGAVVIVPLFEELLFRGLIQTMLRSFLSEAGNRVWLAIAFSSGLFAIMHEEPGHWPALFVLGACMGYAYEKSGSLLRPIFIHAIFNATSLVATLNQ